MPGSPRHCFYRRLSFPIPIELWERPPRLGTHRDEYWDGCAPMSPQRPRRHPPELQDCVIVHPDLQGSGVALMLLAEVVQVLRGLGCPTLTSTFTVENGAGMKGHWRTGFRMPPAVGAEGGGT